MGLDFLFQRAPIIATKKKKRSGQSGDAIEDTDFRAGFEIF
jgi:hypothetical protein